MLKSRYELENALAEMGRNFNLDSVRSALENAEDDLAVNVQYTKAVKAHLAALEKCDWYYEVYISKEANYTKGTSAHYYTGVHKIPKLNGHGPTLWDSPAVSSYSRQRFYGESRPYYETLECGRFKACDKNNARVEVLRLAKKFKGAMVIASGFKVLPTGWTKPLYKLRGTKDG